jgi:hypothetical protein
MAGHTEVLSHFWGLLFSTAAINIWLFHCSLLCLSLWVEPLQWLTWVFFKDKGAELRGSPCLAGELGVTTTALLYWSSLGSLWASVEEEETVCLSAPPARSTQLGGWAPSYLSALWATLWGSAGTQAVSPVDSVDMVALFKQICRMLSWKISMVACVIFTFKRKAAQVFTGH